MPQDALSHHVDSFNRPDGAAQCAREVLTALAQGRPVSSAALAKRAGVTRSALWKQVRALRADGIPVQSLGAAGYRLPWPVQLLDATVIQAALPPHVRTQVGRLQLHWEIDSTSSDIARRLGDLPDNSIVLAETQYAGRGRRGRRWLSPPALNVYLSYLKRFEAGWAVLSGLSLAVGVCVIRALATLNLHGVSLKWPNDVLGGGGKLAGILVELNGQAQGPCAAIIGVGVNVRLTPVLRERAGQPTGDLTALAHGEPVDRNRVAAALIAALVEGLDQFAREGLGAFLDDYARHDALRGKALRLQNTQGEREGIGAGVDARGALLLQTPSGRLIIDSAQVTVRCG